MFTLARRMSYTLRALLPEVIEQHRCHAFLRDGDSVLGQCRGQIGAVQ